MTPNSPRSAGGRPPKFAEPRRPVTLTLPERTLRQLQTLDGDRARAIVKAVDAVTERRAGSPPVELVEIARGQRVILVENSPCLRQIPGVRLLEVAPARFLIFVNREVSVEALEVAIHDILEHTGDERSPPHERQMLEQLRRCLSTSRRGRYIDKAEILVLGPDPG